MTCTWEPDLSVLPDNWQTDDAFTDEQRERALMLATSSLLTLTLNRVGTCPITYRPTHDSRCGCGWNPHIRDGVWRNACPSGKPSEIDLPGPVGYVESMKIDGAEVDLWGGDWRLDDGHLLVWQGAGESPIPTDQDLSKPDTEPGTYSITYSRSHALEPDGNIAVALLAQEFLSAMKPKGKCSLPKGVREITRMGVSMTIEAGLFPRGRTRTQGAHHFTPQRAPPDSPSRTPRRFDPPVRGGRATGGVPARRP